MKRLVVTLAVATLALTGCGGGKTKTTLGSSPSPTTQSLPTGVPSSAASIIAGLTTSQCAAIAKDFSTASAAFSASSDTTPYSVKFAAVAEAFTKAADEIDKPDVKAAMKKIGEVYGKVAEGMKGVTYKPGSGGAPPAAYLAAVRNFADPGFAAASRTMSAYFAGGCK